MTKNLPPYGLLPKRYSATPLADLDPPQDFNALLVPNVSKRRNEKNVFVQEFADYIKDRYWPIWSQSTGDWEGISKNSIIEFTEQDLELLLPLRFLLRTFVEFNDEALMKTHGECFDLENPLDAPPPDLNFGAFRFYVLDLDDKWLQAFPSLFYDALDNKVGPLTIHWKSIFQRPRAYQAALLLNRTDLSHILAPTALHPSLVSGHCMQGVFGGMGVHLLWRRAIDSKTVYLPGVRAALEQYSTDFGDRRVLAGVHYPSDSLISWIACSWLIEHVVKPDEIEEAKLFLRACIQRSRVWAEVRKHKNFNCEAYTKLVDEVSRL